MIRCLILMLVVAGALGFDSEVAEARNRHRSTRRYTTIYRAQPVVRYSTTVTPAGYSQSRPVGTSPRVVTAGMSQPVTRTVSQSSSMQAWAEEEARMMAARGTCGHIRSAPPGYFVGVGCGMTCMGRGQLVAEAFYQGKMVRVWKM